PGPRPGRQHRLSPGHPAPPALRPLLADQARHLVDPPRRGRPLPVPDLVAPRWGPLPRRGRPPRPRARRCRHPALLGRLLSARSGPERDRLAVAAPRAGPEPAGVPSAPGALRVAERE